MIGGLEGVLADRGFGHDGLNEAGTVADRQEVDLAAGTAIVQPAFDGDFLAGVLPDVFDVNVHSFGPWPVVPGPQSFISVSKRRRDSRTRARTSFVVPRSAGSNVNAPS